MARLRFGRNISLRWNGLVLDGPANTVFEIPDEYYEEFNGQFLPVEPTLEWLDADEGSTLRARVTTLEAGGGGGGAALSSDAPLALGTAAAGVGTEASRDDHVHPTTGLALSGHNHSGVYEPVNTAILKSVVDAKGDLIVGTAADTVDRLPGSGTNGYVLTYDSAETTGLKWAVAPGAAGGSPVGNATPLALGTASAGDDNTSSREDHVHPTTGLALSGHNHDGSYSITSHNHDGSYSTTSHNHNSAYAPLSSEGRADIVYEVCKNSSGTTIPAYSVVYVNGSDGTNPTIALADADTDATSSKTLGFTETSSSNGDSVSVLTQGRLTGVDTSGAASAGDSVWLSTTAGGFVFGNPPAEPAHAVYLGVVTKKNPSTGEIFVKVQNGYEIDELHDVSAGSPSNGDVLQYNSTSGMWEKESLATAGIASTSHNHSGVYETAGAVSTHESAGDPHPGYLTETAASSTYATTGHDHSGVYDPAGTASSAVSTHNSSVTHLAIGTTSTTAAAGDHTHAAGAGDVVGPASAVDNTLPRFDTTTGKLIQGSSVVVNDVNNIFAPTSIVQSPKAITESSNTFTINTSESNYITGLTIAARTAPTVVSTASTSFANATTGTLTFGTRATGDIILVLVGSDGSLPVISSTGWTTIASSSANTTFLVAAYKTMGATPDTSISFTGLSTASTASSMVVRGGTLNIYPSVFLETATNSQMRSGPVTTLYSNELVVSMGGMDDFSATGTVTAPSGYTNLTSAVSTGTGFLTAISSKVVSTAETYEYPGAYTTTTSETNGTMTLTFAPSGPGKTVTLTGAPSQAISGYSNAVAQTTVIEYSNSGTPVTWSGVTWSGGVAPSINTNAIITLVTTNGSTYRGSYVDGY